MNQTYTAVIKQDGDWWVGWIEEVAGVNCQDETRDGLLRALKETLIEAIALNREEARNAGGKHFEELAIAV